MKTLAPQSLNELLEAPQHKGAFRGYFDPPELERVAACLLAQERIWEHRIRTGKLKCPIHGLGEHQLGLGPVVFRDLPQMLSHRKRLFQLLSVQIHDSDTLCPREQELLSQMIQSEVWAIVSLAYDQ